MGAWLERRMLRDLAMRRLGLVLVGSAAAALTAALLGALATRVLLCVA